MTSTRRAVIYAVFAACFAAIGGWFAWQQMAPQPVPESATRILYGHSMPDASGQPFELGRLRGQTLVLNFWATWCAPCVEEMPELAGLHREIVDRNATVVGIGIDSPSNISEFAAKGSFPYPLLVAGLDGTELARLLGNETGALPYTVVIDSQGRIVERKLGRIRLEHLRSTVFATIAQAGR